MEKRNWDFWQGSFLTVTAFLLLLMLLAAGCATTDETNPPRSVSEQLLLSTAADRALTNGNFSIFAGKKVYFDSSYFDSYDSKYALGDIRDALSSAGALLVDDKTNSNIIVEARSGGLSTDSSDSLIGIPKMGLPVPLSGSLAIPELPFYKSADQHSIAKFELLAFDTKTRQHIYSSGPLVGRAYNNNHAIFFISWNTTDIPEKLPPKKHKTHKSHE
jgi:hypothetical protein